MTIYEMHVIVAHGAIVVYRVFSLQYIMIKCTCRCLLEVATFIVILVYIAMYRGTTCNKM